MCLCIRKHALDSTLDLHENNFPEFYQSYYGLLGAYELHFKAWYPKDDLNSRLRHLDRCIKLCKLNLIETKWCPKCETPKELSMFNKRTRNKDQLSGYCKECSNRLQRELWGKKVLKELVVYKTRPKKALKTAPEFLQELQELLKENKIKELQTKLNSLDLKEYDALCESYHNSGVQKFWEQLDKCIAREHSLVQDNYIHEIHLPAKYINYDL